MSDMALFASARRTVAVIALALGLVTAASGSAAASTDYTPSGGPSINLVGTNISLLFEEISQTFTCSRFDVSGQVVMPGVARAFGNEAAELGALTDSCTNPYYGPTDFRVKPNWRLTVQGPANGTTVPVRLDQVEMELFALNCVVRFAGTIDGSFDIATQQLAPVASALIVTYWSGPICVTVDFQVGDHVALRGRFTNVPPAGSSPLSLS